MKLRIKFSKHGVMKFIGHLDVMRYFQKAMRRADIDISYTTGFSPHQIMSFAAPLGVGLESNGEYLDIEANSVTSSADMTARLNAVMVDGMHVESVRMLPETAGNAMASVAAAKYSIGFATGKEPSFDLKNAVSAFMSKDTILVTKQTKKSEVELDLKPYIYEMTSENGILTLFVDASSSGNIKPALVMEALYKENGCELPEFALQVTREDTYTNIGTEEAPEFVPLEDIGHEF
ncbi:MAG: DUF2344 domain-containing protein [Lachnospiraceae bacterium]|nr:DUF2344 domain-containing protein [Lachnospiraceae bacterium]